MYDPRQTRRQEQGVRRPGRHRYLEAALAAPTAVFWASAQGEWTNKVLSHGLVWVIGFIVAFPYLPALYFAPRRP